MVDNSMFGKMIRWASPPGLIGNWLEILMIPPVLCLVAWDYVILPVKARVRKLVIFSKEPTDIEYRFAALWLKRNIQEKTCPWCSVKFWTIGKAEICRHVRCYMMHKGRLNV